VPPTVPEVGGVVVSPLLLPQAARRRVEARIAARVEFRVFMGRLSTGPTVARSVDASGRGGAECVRGHLMWINYSPEGSEAAQILDRTGTAQEGWQFPDIEIVSNLRH